MAVIAQPVPERQQDDEGGEEQHGAEQDDLAGIHRRHLDCGRKSRVAGIVYLVVTFAI
jgi:hypothetical protein